MSADDRTMSAERAAAATLRHHLARSPNSALRLGDSLLQELAFRAQQASSAAGLPPNEPMLLAPDPGAWVRMSDGRRCALSELGLPSPGSAGDYQLRSTIHACCCEANAAMEQWIEAAEHGRAGMEALRGLRRAARHGTSPPAWIAWRELCLAHAAQLAEQMQQEHSTGGGGGGGGSSSSWASANADARRALLRELNAHCEWRSRDHAAAARSSSLSALLRLVTAIASSALQSANGGSPDTGAEATAIRAEVLRTVCTALRCAHGELGASSSARPCAAHALAHGDLDGRDASRAGRDRRGGPMPPEAGHLLVGLHVRLTELEEAEEAEEAQEAASALGAEEQRWGVEAEEAEEAEVRGGGGNEQRAKRPRSFGGDGGGGGGACAPRRMGKDERVALRAALLDCGRLALVVLCANGGVAGESLERCLPDPWQCGGLPLPAHADDYAVEIAARAAFLAREYAREGGRAREPSPCDAPPGRCMLSSLPDERAGGSLPPTLRRSIACALYVRAACLAHEAFACALQGCSPAMLAYPGASHAMTAAEVLRVAEQAASRAVALRARPSPMRGSARRSLDVDAPDAAAATEALTCRSALALLQMIDGRPHEGLLQMDPVGLLTDDDDFGGGGGGGGGAGGGGGGRGGGGGGRGGGNGLGGHGGPTTPQAQQCAIGPEHATLGAVLRARCGDAPGSLEALKHALAVGSTDGRAPALPLYNLLCHYDAAREADVALRLCGFLLEADFDPALAVTGARALPPAAAPPPQQQQPCHYLAVAPGNRSPPLWLPPSSLPASSLLPSSLHDARATLSPIAARYLRARALLVAREWEPAGEAYRSLLASERALRPALRALGVSEAAFLRQLGLAMLWAGEHTELLALLRARGALGDPALADLVADALISEHEPAAALDALDAAPPLSASPQPSASPRPVAAMAPASQQPVSDARLPSMAGAGAGDAAAPATAESGADAELRYRNNRACYLLCQGQPAAAEAELLAACRLSPSSQEPQYNLALLRWSVGERRAAAAGWLAFRGWQLTKTPDVYEHLAASVRPGPDVAPAKVEGVATGHVDAASVAALDRAMLHFWAERRSREEMTRHWNRGNSVEAAAT